MKHLTILILLAGICFGTVSVTTVKTAPTVGDGSTVAFVFSFSYTATSEIVVTSRVTATGVPTVQTETTHYSVSAPSDTGGTVTFVTAPASTVTITISRTTPQTQSNDIDASSYISLTALEASHDKAMRLIQELQEENARTPKFPITDASSTLGGWGNSVDRASKFPYFGNDGVPTTMAGVTADDVVVSTYMETVLDDTSAAAAQATLLLKDGSAELNVADIITTSPIFDVRYYGVTGDGVDEITEIQAAVDAAELVNGVLYFPTPPIEYVISDRILIDSSITVIGSGLNCNIRQTTWGKPIFEVRADDIWIDGFFLETTESRTSITNATHDSLANGLRTYNAGVYIANSERTRLTNLKISGFVAGIRPRGETDNSTLNEGLFIQNIWIDTVDQGIIPRQQKGMIINNVQVSDYVLSQSGDPAHALYFIGSSGVLNADCSVSNVLIWDGTDGQAVQIKFSERCTFDNITAHTTPGLLVILEEVTDCIFTNFTGLNQQSVTASAAIVHLSGQGTRRNRISNVNIASAVAGQVALSILNQSGTNDDNVIENVLFTDSAASDSTEVANLRGVRNVIRNFRINCTDIARKGVNISNGTDCVLDGIQIENGQGTNFFVIQGTSTSAKIFYNAELLNLSDSLTISDSGTTTLLIDKSDFLKVTTVNLTASQIKNLASAPQTLVAAPGTGLYLEFISAVLILDKGGTAYDDAAGDGNMIIRYTDGSGVVVSQDIEADGFIDETSDFITNAIPKKDGIVAATGSVNKALVLDNDGAEYTTGDGVLRIKITTRTQRSLGL